MIVQASFRTAVCRIEAWSRKHRWAFWSLVLLLLPFLIVASAVLLYRWATNLPGETVEAGRIAAAEYADRWLEQQHTKPASHTAGGASGLLSLIRVVARDTDPKSTATVKRSGRAWMSRSLFPFGRTYTWELRADDGDDEIDGYLTITAARYKGRMELTEIEVIVAGGWGESEGILPLSDEK